MKNQLQSVNLIAQFDNGLCLEIKNIYIEDTNNIAKIREEPLKLLNLLLPSTPLYFNLDRGNYLKVSRDLKDSIKTFFSKFEVSSLADKESCLSIAFDELKKTSNLSYILSSI